MVVHKVDAYRFASAMEDPGNEMTKNDSLMMTACVAVQNEW